MPARSLAAARTPSLTPNLPCLCPRAGCKTPIGELLPDADTLALLEEGRRRRGGADSSDDDDDDEDNAAGGGGGGGGGMDEEDDV